LKTKSRNRGDRGEEEEEESAAMDIISQLQEQLNEMAMVAVNTFGTLQRDAPPVRLSTAASSAPACARPRRAAQGHEPRARPRRKEGAHPVSSRSFPLYFLLAICCRNSFNFL
jgi:hypothetical protein